jgi:hypothetical protein
MNKMILCFAIGVLALGGGCGEGDEVTNTVADMCTRLDDCNFLEGISVQECIDNRTNCVDVLNDSQLNDWTVMMEDCLQLQSCSLYGDCWLDVPWC